MAENEEKIREELLKLLRMHDWYYEYADDYSVWTCGNDRWKRIASLAHQLPDGDTLIQTHRPKSA